MKRKQLEALIAWGSQKNKNPLLITGAKHVGKTYLALEFVTDFFNNRIYFNFEQNPSAKKLFEGVDTEVFKHQLREYYKVDIEKGGVIVLDEIGFCPHAVSLISLLLKEIHELCAIFITSCAKGWEMPCNTEIIKMYPLDFKEFLEAVGYDWYGDIIEEHFCRNKPVPVIFHGELLKLMDKYLITGGLPAAVEEYVKLNTASNAAQYHQTAEFYYMEYLHRLLDEGAYLRAKGIYDSIDRQLSKKNKKFQYRLVRKGSTSSQFAEEISQLLAHEFLIKSENINKNGFKLYFSDTGMLMSRGTVNEINSDPGQSYEFSKGLLENYVGQCLHQNGFPLLFWESGFKSKVDFVVKIGEQYIPIEIYLDDKTRSRNVSEFHKLYPSAHSIKISAKNFSYAKGVKYVPLYAVFCIRPE